jgi:lysophospholipase L1-like esterase
MRYSYLALGDSYTIGESVTADENFPSQTVALLNNSTAVGIKTAVGVGNRRQGFDEPIIIAKTGWTTDELDAAIDAAAISTTFDIVTLLIGVNNQYRGRSVNEYKTQFDHLLQRAIHFAGNKTDHVFVLSIPDWGVTPFAEGRNRQEISHAIDAYNDTAKQTCEQYGIIFIDITTAQRADGNNAAYLAADLLHPSGKEYAKWAKQLSAAIHKLIAS